MSKLGQDIFQCFECGKVFLNGKEMDDLEAEQLPADAISNFAKLCQGCYWMEKATD